MGQSLVPKLWCYWEVEDALGGQEYRKEVRSLGHVCEGHIGSLCLLTYMAYMILLTYRR